MLKEWPLVAFTILGQTAVGISLLFFLPLALASANDWGPEVDEAVRMITALVLVLLVVATGISMFHLRHPFRARRVLANIRTSWLSREIFFEIAFMGLVGLAFVLVWTGNTNIDLLKAVMVAAMLSGILFLVSMSKLYMLESVPSWDSVHTGISFSLTAMTLGAAVTAWVALSMPGHPYSFSSALWTAALFFGAADLFFAALLTPRYGIAASRLRPSLRPPARAPRLLQLGRLVFLAGGLFLIVLAMAKATPDAPWGIDSALGVATDDTMPLLILAFVLVLLGEVAGRFLFYGLVRRPGD